MRQSPNLSGSVLKKGAAVRARG